LPIDFRRFICGRCQCRREGVKGDVEVLAVSLLGCEVIAYFFSDRLPFIRVCRWSFYFCLHLCYLLFKFSVNLCCISSYLPNSVTAWSWLFWHFCLNVDKLLSPATLNHFLLLLSYVRYLNPRGLAYHHGFLFPQLFFQKLIKLFFFSPSGELGVTALTFWQGIPV